MVLIDENFSFKRIDPFFTETRKVLVPVKPGRGVSGLRIRFEYGKDPPWIPSGPSQPTRNEGSVTFWESIVEENNIRPRVRDTSFTLHVYTSSVVHIYICSFKRNLPLKSLSSFQSRFETQVESRRRNCFRGKDFTIDSFLLK